MIKNYLKTAFRSFGRHKLFTFINVIGLAIGISAALVIFLIVNYDYSFDRFRKDRERVFHIGADMNFGATKMSFSAVPGPMPKAIRDEVTGIETVAPIYTYDYKVVIPAKTPAKFKDENIVYANKYYFDIFPEQWLAGSPNTALNEPLHVVLAAKQAKKYFPALSYRDMVGKEVIYADSIKTVVSGVIADRTENTDLSFHDYISFSTIDNIKDIKKQLDDWTALSSASQVFIKISPNSNEKKINAQLRALLFKYQPEEKKKGKDATIYHLVSFANMHFDTQYGTLNNPEANKTTLYGLMAIGSFLLLLGCINFVNLTTAQASQRAREIGVRKTLGSSRTQLMFQYLSETVLLTLIAVILSMVFVPLILKLFSDFVSPDIKFDPLHQPVVIVFAILLTIVVGFVSGLYPALVISKFKPVTALKNQAYTNSNKTRNAWLRKTLTVTQFIIAQFFIVATILVSKQIHYALNKDLGFKKDAIVIVNMPFHVKNPGLENVYTEKVRQLPQVELVSRGASAPSTSGWSSSMVKYADGKKEIKTDLFVKSGDENYIKVYHIKLLAGRNIKLSDSTDAMLINETYAHMLGFKNVADAVGKTIIFGDKRTSNIVGVINDFHQGSLHMEIKPLAIFPQMYQFNTLHIALHPQTAGGNEWVTAIASMKNSWKRLFPDDDFDYQFFDKSIAKMYENEQHMSQLLTWSMGLSIFISCLGLLGLAIFTTSVRTKEIGVRKILGATVTQIVTLLSSELVLLVGLAFAIVTPVAVWAANKWMESFVDRTPISWWIFVLSGAGMLATALLTLSSQTIRAAIANPVKSLRSE